MERPLYAEESRSWVGQRFLPLLTDIIYISINEQYFFLLATDLFNVTW